MSIAILIRLNFSFSFFQILEEKKLGHKRRTNIYVRIIIIIFNKFNYIAYMSVLLKNIYVSLISFVFVPWLFKGNKKRKKDEEERVKK